MEHPSVKLDIENREQECEQKNGGGCFLATFECPGCLRKWKSGNSWKKTCRICKHTVVAYQTEKSFQVHHGKGRLLDVYKCLKCKRTWKSGKRNCWKGRTQQCRRCQETVSPSETTQESEVSYHGDIGFLSLFKCPKCLQKWKNMNSWKDKAERCAHCKTPVSAYEQREFEHTSTSINNKATSFQKENSRHLCGKRNELRGYCGRIEKSYSGFLWKARTEAEPTLKQGLSEFTKQQIISLMNDENKEKSKKSKETPPPPLPSTLPPPPPLMITKSLNKELNHVETISSLSPMKRSKKSRADQTKAAGIIPSPLSVDGSIGKIQKKRSMKSRVDQTKAAGIIPSPSSVDGSIGKIPKKRSKKSRADQTKAAEIIPSPSSVDGSIGKIPEKRSKKSRADQTKAAGIIPNSLLTEENNVKIPEKYRVDHQTKPFIGRMDKSEKFKETFKEIASGSDQG